MSAVVPGAAGARHGWRLVSRTGQGADVLARAAAASPLPTPEALRRLRDGDGTLSVVRGPGAHFRWILIGAAGAFAESPAIYRDTEACREAFVDAQHAAGSALGGVRRHRPDTGDRSAPDAVTAPDRSRP